MSISHKSSRAFCPGHVTGFFRIMDGGKDSDEIGSLGSGFNTTAGAITTAAFGNEYDPVSEDSIAIGSNFFLIISASEGGTILDDLPVTRDMVTRFFDLLDDRGIEGFSGNGKLLLELETRFELPMGQGFGMSGAGLISQVLAVNDLLGSPFTRRECIGIAHASEVKYRTGLGDIPPQSVGGFTIREREGLPPHGMVHSWPLENPVLLGVLGADVRTSGILLDEDHKKSINDSSKHLVNKLLTQPSIERMVDLSFRFAGKTGLMTNKIENICSRINELVSPGASMCMLGNSIFVIFPEETSVGDVLYRDVKAMLESKGRIFETAICPHGARVL